jgi:hypothetical protein
LAEEDSEEEEIEQEKLLSENLSEKLLADFKRMLERVNTKRFVCFNF